jgi:hypothetical protein
MTLESMYKLDLEVVILKYVKKNILKIRKRKNIFKKKVQ